MINFFSTLFASFKKLLSIAEWKDTIDNVDALRKFITHNSNFVSQTSLYGYIKTRSGIQYPRIFEDNSYIKQLNIAKWRIWIAASLIFQYLLADYSHRVEWIGMAASLKL